MLIGTDITLSRTGVAGGHRQPDEHAECAADQREEHRLDEELDPDVALRRTERAAHPDLGPALEDGDHHHVGDADAADEEGDGAEAEQRARNVSSTTCLAA